MGPCNITINKALSWQQVVTGACRHPSSRRATPSIHCLMQVIFYDYSSSAVPHQRFLYRGIAIQVISRQIVFMDITPQCLCPKTSKLVINFMQTYTLPLFAIVLNEHQSRPNVQYQKTWRPKSCLNIHLKDSDYFPQS